MRLSVILLLALASCNRSAQFDRSAATTSPQVNAIADAGPSDTNAAPAQSTSTAARVGQQMRSAAAKPPPIK